MTLRDRPFTAFPGTGSQTRAAVPGFLFLNMVLEDLLGFYAHTVSAYELQNQLDFSIFLIVV